MAIKEIAGPVRAISGEKITFKVLKLTVDGRTSDGSDLTSDEAKKIQWVIKEATAKTATFAVNASVVASFKLTIGKELARGTGKQFEYTVPADMVGRAVVAMAYVNSPSHEVAQWVKVSNTNNFQASGITHKALSLFPANSDRDKLAADFKEKWIAFEDALKEAKATVQVQSTLRPIGRAYMMHYSTLLALGKIKPWEVPDQISNRFGDATGHMGIEWSHTTADGRVDLARSKKAAIALMHSFRIAFPPSLTSNHVRGRAIDVRITWQGSLKIREKGSIGKDNKVIEGKLHEITSLPKHGGLTAEPAGNKKLREVAETYGIHKLINDAPHWSEDGK